MLLILTGDKPIFEYNFNRPQKLQTYFIIHSCLDAIDNVLDFRKQFYLGQLRTQQIPIFCYVNATGMKLLLVFTGKRQFDKKMDMLIKDFLVEINRHLTILLMNPLYGGGTIGNRRKITGYKKNTQNVYQNQQIKSSSFQDRVNTLGKQYLRPFFEKKKTQVK